MSNIVPELRRGAAVVVHGAMALVMASFLLVTESDGEELKGWRLEQDVERPTYVFTTPAAADIDIDTIVLTCNEIGESRVLQLELYPVDPLPLAPPGATMRDLRDDPHLQLSVDGRVFPVSMFFADDHVIVADMSVGRLPVVSKSLVDAMVNGSTMNLRFQLLAKHPGEVPAYDGRVTIDLQAGAGAAGIAAVRDCLLTGEERISRTVR